MKTKILACSFLLLPLLALAQKAEWADFVYSIQNFNGGTGIVSDINGNVYVLATISDQVILQGDTIINTYGDRDLILIKYSPQGFYVRSKVFGGPGADNSFELAIDAAGHLYAASLIQGVTSMNDTTYTAMYSNQIVQFDTAFNFKRYVTHNGGIAVTAAGLNAFIAYASTVEKLDTSLNTIWSQTDPTNTLTFSDYGPQTGTGDIMVAENGHLVVSGHENGNGGSCLFDTVVVTFADSGLVDEMFVISMDTSGAALWAGTFDSTSVGTEETPVAAIDNAGNVYLAFESAGSPIFFANDTLFNSIEAGGAYQALLKFDMAGNPQWGMALHAKNTSVIYDMLVNQQQDLLLCGYTSGPMALGNYSASYGALEINPFVIKMNPAGTVSWRKTDEHISFGTSYFAALTQTPSGDYATTGFYPSIFPDGYHLGCYFALPNGRDIITTLISESQEPVPATGFTVLQAGNRVLCKDTTQNAVSFTWNFGDGTTSQLKQPIHEYAQPGVYDLCLTATNLCGTNLVCKTVNVRGIRAIDSDHGSNRGVMTADVFGGGFTSNATVLLKKATQADVIPVTTTYINSGHLQVRFDLTGKQEGRWDVEVTIPADTVMTLVNGFTVDTSDYALDATIHAPSETHRNQWTPCMISVENKSGLDAVGVPFLLRINPTLNDFPDLSLVPPQQIPFLNSGYQYLTANLLNTSVAGFSIEDSLLHSVFFSGIIPLIKANSSVNIPFYLHSSQDLQSINKFLALGPLLESTALTGTNTPSFDFCFGEFLRTAAEKAFSTTIPAAQWDACFPALYDSLLNAVSLRANHITESEKPIAMQSAVVSIVSQMAVTGCVPGIPAQLTDSQMHAVVSWTVANLLLGIDSSFNITNCQPVSPFRKPQHFSDQLLGVSMGDWVIKCEGGAWPMPENFDLPAVSAAVYLTYVYEADPNAKLVPKDKCIWYKGSADPNIKTGPGNNNDDIFEKPNTLFSYTIAFENVDTALAPAMVVSVTDTLDASRFDFNTFRFGLVRIGDSVRFEFEEPGFSQLQLTSLAPMNSNFLRTEAVFDTSTGIITWLFTTVDGTDYQPDTVSFNGFLPPNVNGTEGTGFVSYEVRLKPGLVTGDTISNNATIVFDSNAPITTGSWTNVIDITKPQSAVNPMPAQVADSSIVISWTGSDFIAGILGYGIYVSVNDGPYTLWRAYGDTTQDVFTGVNGSKYEFVSIAFDRAFNVEDPPFDPGNNPDAVTTISIGIEELEDAIRMKIFPNPVGSELNIVSSEKVKSVKILNALGEAILSQDLSQATDLLQFPTSDLSKGIYFVKLVSENKTGCARFIKTE